MLNFIITNYLVFIWIAIFLSLGLIGYIGDRKRYEKYRSEIINETNIPSPIAQPEKKKEEKLSQNISAVEPPKPAIQQINDNENSTN